MGTERNLSRDRHSNLKNKTKKCSSSSDSSFDSSSSNSPSRNKDNNKRNITLKNKVSSKKNDSYHSREFSKGNIKDKHRSKSQSKTSHSSESRDSSSKSIDSRDYNRSTNLHRTRQEKVLPHSKTKNKTSLTDHSVTHKSKNDAKSRNELRSSNDQINSSTLKRQNHNSSHSIGLSRGNDCVDTRSSRYGDLNNSKSIGHPHRENEHISQNNQIDSNKGKFNDCTQKISSEKYRGSRNSTSSPRTNKSNKLIKNGKNSKADCLIVEQSALGASVVEEKWENRSGSFDEDIDDESRKNISLVNENIKSDTNDSLNHNHQNRNSEVEVTVYSQDGDNNPSGNLNGSPNFESSSDRKRSRLQVNANEGMMVNNIKSRDNDDKSSLFHDSKRAKLDFRKNLNLYDRRFINSNNFQHNSVVEKKKRNDIKERMKQIDVFRVDRTRVCPFLLRLFLKINDSHKLSDFVFRNNVQKIPVQDELQIYTWIDARLREIFDLIKDLLLEARLPNTTCHFSLIFLDRFGNMTMNEIGYVHSNRLNEIEDSKTLHSAKFQIGDFISISIRTNEYRKQLRPVKQ